MPRQLQRLLRLKADVAKRKEERKARRAATGEEEKRRRREEKDLLDSTRHMGYETRLPGMKRPLRPVPVFKQEPAESEKRFLNRVEVTCKVTAYKI